MIYKWAMTSIANGLVTRGYSKVGTCWDQLSYQNWVVSGSGGPTSQHIPASKLCTPESLELRSGLLATWLAEHPMARVFTSFHVFSRLFTSFRVFALSQEKHLQVGAWVLKLLDRVLMCALILWVPGWTPGLWLQWVSESINLPCACAINLENRTNSYPQIVPQCTTCIQTSSNIRIAIWT